ncbi:hypothetical protein F8388_023898 [Cannabis sativa]|uniref:Uncharacterized protein n=1 Tax=Cannabis sativa TaxID=3483 RepID=A0A7J6EUS0_CANSA|nr:hypothetical protein F8388_023898 [Cannabis sativa]KAF4398162.1 hypothetical protein G4B88_019883 [Cannabis sativa]
MSGPGPCRSSRSSSGLNSEFGPRRPIPLSTSSISLPKTASSPFRRFLDACLRSGNARGVSGAELPKCQSEIIFMVTGTSEGIPCVCSKAAEPGTKNRRLPPHSICHNIWKRQHPYRCGKILLPQWSSMVSSLLFTPLPVWHGRGYRSLAMLVKYLKIPEETYPLLKDCEILIMDALRTDRSSSTHFGLPKVRETIRFCTCKGMMHRMDHEKVNNYLMKLMETEGLDVELNYDGLRNNSGGYKAITV